MQTIGRSAATGRGLRVLSLCACALGITFVMGCGEESDVPPAAPAQPLYGDGTEGEYVTMGGLQVPFRRNLDPGLPDSCELLADARAQAMFGEPVAAAERMSDLCVVYPKSSQTWDRALTVEVRRPVPLEVERGIPADEEQFWTAEGAGIGLVGGVREELQEIDGLGSYAVWYPIRGGLALHAYWDGAFILAINVRGLPTETGLEWAKGVAARAISRTAELGAGAGDGATG